MESKPVNSNTSDTINVTIQGQRSHRSYYCGESTCPSECKTFADWGDLKSYLVRAYELEDVVVQLRPDYVSSETIDCFDRMEMREISSSEVLLSLSVGLRVSLDVHLFRASLEGVGFRDWQPRDQYRSILMCAKGVFTRSVRDRMVDLMSTRERKGVVSFFLDGEGQVDSASNKARDFCDKHFPGSKRVDDYFPQAHWDYLQGAIRLRERTALSYRDESMVFCFHQESGIVDCLLQKMGENGYLLSLALDR